MLRGLASKWLAIVAKADGTKEIAKQMMETTVPAEHQALGRKAKGFNRKEWDQRKSNIMSCQVRGCTNATYADKSRIVEEGNYHKFTKSTPEMRQKLLDTGDRELVEVRSSPS